MSKDINGTKTPVLQDYSLLYMMSLYMCSVSSYAHTTAHNNVLNHLLTLTKLTFFAKVRELSYI